MNIYILNATINGKLLTEILSEKIEIKGIITLDDNGGDFTPEYYDYTDFCEDKKLKCYKMHSYELKNSEDRDVLENLDIDLIIIASWQRLLPTWLINHCSIGIIGAHGSHEGITKGRGRSPQNWALMMGQEKLNMSIFWVDPGIDDGEIIDSCEFTYLPTDDILVSYIKINVYKADMILRNLQNGRIARREGDKQNAEGLYLPKRTKEDGMIDWNRNALDIYNMVRALTKPYPGAFTKINGREIMIWSAKPVITTVSYLFENLANGTIISLFKGSALVKCGKDMLLVDSCSDYESLKEGQIFESADFKEQIQKIVDRHREKYDTPLSRLVLDVIEDD